MKVIEHTGRSRYGTELDINSLGILVSDEAILLRTESSYFLSSLILEIANKRPFQEPSCSPNTKNCAFKALNP